MQRLSRTLLLLALALTQVGAAHAGDTYRFGVSLTPPPPAEAPRVTALGTLTINNSLKLPAFAVDVVHAGEESGWLQERPAAMQVRGSLDSHSGRQLAAYHTHGGWLLVPRDWKVLAGGVGANGTSSIAFVSPDRRSYLTYFDASACVGCAQSAASVFFPEAARDARSNDFTVYDKPTGPFKLTRLGPHRVAYRGEASGQPVDGVAYYNSQSDLPFHKFEVSLPASQRKLATAMLNWILREPR